MERTELQKTARNLAIKWSRQLLSNGFLALDTETTGTATGDEVVQLTVLHYAPDGITTSVINELVQPARAEISHGAMMVHGITPAKLKAVSAKAFTHYTAPLLSAMQGIEVVAYNAAFDVRMIKQSCTAHRALPSLLERELGRISCAMLQYAGFVGEPSRNAKGGFRWQKLPGASHNAQDDCVALIQLIKRMANTPTEEQAQALNTLRTFEHGTGAIKTTPPEQSSLFD